MAINGRSPTMADKLKTKTMQAKEAQVSTPAAQAAIDRFYTLASIEAEKGLDSLSVDLSELSREEQRDVRWYLIDQGLEEVSGRLIDGRLSLRFSWQKKSCLKVCSPTLISSARGSIDE